MRRPRLCTSEPINPQPKRSRAGCIWASPAGKVRLAPLLARLLPEHKTYVEPFAGSGAVLLAKRRAAVEVVNDLDPDIAHAFRVICGLDDLTWQAVVASNWRGSKQMYDALRTSEPGDGLQRLHRFLYLNRFGVGAIRESGLFDFRKEGRDLDVAGYLDRHAPRLAGVQVREGDYETAVREFDGADTAFFMDPPYAGYGAGVGEAAFNERRFFELLIGLRGKWLLTYGIRGRLPALLKAWGCDVRRIQPKREMHSVNHDGPKVLTQLVVANYELRDFARLRAAHLAGRLEAEC